MFILCVRVRVATVCIYIFLFIFFLCRDRMQNLSRSNTVHNLNPLFPFSSFRYILVLVLLLIVLKLCALEVVCCSKMLAVSLFLVFQGVLLSIGTLFFLSFSIPLLLRSSALFLPPFTYMPYLTRCHHITLAVCRTSRMKWLCVCSGPVCSLVVHSHRHSLSSSSFFTHLAFVK